MNYDRFKFRVWDEVTKRYLNRAYLAMDSGGALVHVVDGGFEPYSSEEVDGLIIEQCTGRKDRNGKLIYEGDIISGSNGSINGRYWTFKREIKWDEKKGFSVPNWGSKESWSHWYEVVGNIHENPELLEEKE